MENKDLAVAQIVSAIISKEDVLIGADNENGVFVHIKKATELLKEHRSTISLEDLIKLVKEAL
ncbi:MULTISPECIES: hypothetical protein [unclassified Bacillus cereus group]|uniref:hypothetical protein n=1 Tax=unclassified Bacillus cereus group TaxID=2750818 RepID=UPI0022DFD980|nr:MULTISPECIES: hypothetical protein [unclassified Bacillus cereus group]MDA2216007.1 hypothetical protein [Bacillus cereus group sp. Bc228]MDA2227729.1 hypothetical protein [Bacillus cereus group sp. Bc227]